MFEAIKPACERWSTGSQATKEHPLTAQEMRTCLRCLMKSVEFWTEHGGRQDYVQYVSQFIV